MELGFGKSESIPFYKMNSKQSFRIASSLSSLLLSATLYKDHHRSNSILSLTKLKGVKNSPLKKVYQSMAATALDKSVPEKLPPLLEATADQPPLFDGTIRLYTAYICPFAQLVWITRNYKGLQDKINLVPLDLQNRPSWYKEKVYSVNKVPALEHNGKIIGESLDLIKYLDSNFEGPSLLPDDPAKKEFAEELFSYTDTFNQIVLTSFKGDAAKEAVPAFDYLENALHKFDDGPFLLGQFSLVDIAYIPFVERFQIFLLEVFKYDVTTGRPKLSAWIEEINKIEAYKQTKRDPKEFIELYKKRFQIQ